MTNVQKKKFKTMKTKLKGNAGTSERRCYTIFFDKYAELQSLKEHWTNSVAHLAKSKDRPDELKKGQEESSEILILSPMEQQSD